LNGIRYLALIILYYLVGINKSHARMKYSLRVSATQLVESLRLIFNSRGYENYYAEIPVDSQE